MKLKKAYFIAVALGLLGAEPLWANEPICAETFAELAEPVAQQLVFDPRFHECGECLANSGEMGRELIRRFKQDGIAYDLKDFEIAVIFDRRIRKYRDEDEFRLKHGIFHSDHHEGSESEPIPYKFHAVLVYKGMVLDMDLKSEVILPWDEYVQLAFPPRVADELGDGWGTLQEVEVNQPHQLLASRIPLARYLKRFPERPGDTFDLQRRFIFRKGAQPIDGLEFGD